jgi:small-conductance mechanosensitive channel
MCYTFFIGGIDSKFVVSFVSGLTLRFEQSLRPGDVIELDCTASLVNSATLRYTIVRTPDNAEHNRQAGIYT